MIIGKRAAIASLMRLIVALEAIERGTWTILVGLVFLAIGVLYNWVLVPSGSLSSFEAGTLNITVFEPEEAWLFRLMVLIAAAFLLFGVLRGERARFAARGGIWAMLAAALAFPCAVNLWEPGIALDTALSWSRLDDVIWTEMDTSYDDQQTAWRGYQRLSPMDRKDLVIFSAPLGGIFPLAPGGGGGISMTGSFGRNGSLLSDGLDPTLFRLARHLDIASQIFGYSNAFLNVACKGWFCTLIGCIVAIVGLYLPEHRGNRSFRRDLCLVLPFYALLLVALLTPRAIAEVLIADGLHAAAQGDNLAAEHDLREAARWKPILKDTLAFHAKMGELTLARNCADCADSLLYLAFEAMQQSRLNVAIELFERCESRYPVCRHNSYWLAFAYEQRAVRLFNIGQAAAAAADWRRSLVYYPLNAHALYGYSLAQFQMGDFGAAANALKQMVDIQDLFFWKRPPPRSQWYLAEAWTAFRRGDIAQAHEFYSLSLTPDNW